MTLLRGLDSAGFSAGAADKAAGYTVIGRYIVGPYAMDGSEILTLTRLGLAIIAIFELQAQAALGGASQGRLDGYEAVKQARWLRLPLEAAIFATVDFEPEGAQLASVVGYLREFSDVVRLAGFKSGSYGGVAVQRLVIGLVDYRWQTAAWSYGAIASGVDILQNARAADVGGVRVDVDQILNEHCGAWNYDGLWPPKPPPPPVPPKPKTPSKATLALRALKASIKAVVTSNTGYCQVPATGGQAVVNKKAMTFQGIPDIPTLNLLIAAGCKQTSVARSFWAKAKQLPWS